MGLLIGIEKADRGVGWSVVLPEMKDAGAGGSHRAEMGMPTVPESNDLTTDGILLCGKRVQHKGNVW